VHSPAGMTSPKLLAHAEADEALAAGVCGLWRARREPRETVRVSVASLTPVLRAVA
jgi:hypothetical protein